ncbi:MAG: TrbI/VirB10 family protein [Candidatus Rickettsiella isopodorum]|jgi:type IV secretory pathway VirB10-like protein
MQEPYNMSPQHPKTVVLRKTWILIATILLLVIISLILNNLYRASHQSHRSNKVDKTLVASSPANTRWYQQQTVAELPTPPVILPMPILKQENEFSEADLKAMSEPISSHQLKAALPSVTNTTNSTTEKSGTVQNRQSEKKAFIQIKATDSNVSNSLVSRLQNLDTPFELQAGSIIPGVMITGVNSDLPGQIIAQVRSNIYDSPTGKYLLIPQGSRLTGQYDSQITYGQQRILIIWKRIIFPNGQSIDLQGMPGIDRQGYAGFKGDVNNHYLRLFGSAILMSIIGTGAQLAAPIPDNVLTPLTVKQALAQSLNSNLVNISSSVTAKNLNIQPTLEVQPGYEFNISVTKDMVFPKSYSF